ncbi:MAG: hypothetical protein M1813_002247 [Trichoglossum hirsutum]|nr:MAG: hypothetical protein M1813_002247 [Trichoglossum hirsutum]
MCASGPVPGPAPSLYTYSPATMGSVVSDGYTFYADKVYISFEYVMAQRGFGYDGGTTQVGQTYRGRILTMESAALSSMRYPDYGIAYPFNFADLNSPFPWSALAGMWDCYAGFCATISQDYRPELEVPPEVRQLDPEWADCALDWQGLYDPPHALTLTTALVDQHTPAAPSSSIQPNWAPNPTTGITALGGLVIGGSTVPFSVPEPTPIPPPSTVTGAVFTASDHPITAVQLPGSSGTIAIGPTTLSVGGPAATIDGHVVSAEYNGIVVDGTAVQLSTILSDPIHTQGPVAEAGFNANGLSATALQIPGSPGIVVIGSSTLYVGGPAVTIDGKLVSLNPNGMVIGDVTIQLSTVPASQAVFTLMGHPITAFQLLGSPGTVTIGLTTLSIGGPAVTIDGQLVSLGPNGIVVAGTSTISFSNVPANVAATTTRLSRPRGPSVGNTTSKIGFRTGQTANPSPTASFTLITSASSIPHVETSLTVPDPAPVTTASAKSSAAATTTKKNSAERLGVDRWALGLLSLIYFLVLALSV